jgi:hypothetical protein
VSATSGMIFCASLRNLSANSCTDSSRFCLAVYSWEKWKWSVRTSRNLSLKAALKASQVMDVSCNRRVLLLKALAVSVTFSVAIRTLSSFVHWPTCAAVSIASKNSWTGVDLSAPAHLEVNHTRERTLVVAEPDCSLGLNSCASYCSLASCCDAASVVAIA